MKTNKKFRLIALLSISLTVSGSIVAVTAAKGFKGSRTSANGDVYGEISWSNGSKDRHFVKKNGRWGCVDNNGNVFF